MKFKAIKDFLAIVRNASIRNDKQVRLSLHDAQKLQTEISMLLLELKEADTTTEITIFDGGKFK